MNIVVLSTYDTGSGAAVAAHRLSKGLQQTGHNCQMLVQQKRSHDASVIPAYKTRFQQSVARCRVSLDAMPLKLYPNRKRATFSLSSVPERIRPIIDRLNPDIINLHWLNEAYLNINTLKHLRQPLVWTLHDMWAFTGGCHYSGDCDRYTNHCGQCPTLDSDRELDLSYWTWHRKHKAWANLNLTIVTPSRWLADCARKSSLLSQFRIEAIPNGLDLALYQPRDQRFARDVLGLPQDKHLLLFGALGATSDKRKGFHLLQQALQKLSYLGHQDHVELVVFGSEVPPNPPDFGLKVHYLGCYSDDLSLSLIYSAADAFILPSIQENLANTVVEALACGCPAIAFDIGGTPDLIEHQVNGYLAQAYDIKDLAHGILWVLDNTERRQQLQKSARDKAEQEFSQNIQASRYSNLFSKILNES